MNVRAPVDSCVYCPETASATGASPPPAAGWTGSRGRSASRGRRSRTSPRPSSPAILPRENGWGW